MSSAADILGVHANTVRAWTDQGLLTCLRINRRGDRRYRRADIDRFLAQAKVDPTRPARAAHPSGGSSASASSERPASRQRTNAVLDEVARIAAGSDDVERLVRDVATVLCEVGGYAAATMVDEHEVATPLVGRLRSDSRIVAQVMSTHQPSVTKARRDDGSYRAALPVPTEVGGNRVLLLAGTSETRSADEEALLRTVAAQLVTVAAMRSRIVEAAHGTRRAQLVMAISHDLGQLDLPQMLNQLVERLTELFDADAGGVFTRLPTGGFRAEATLNLSDEFAEWAEHASALPVVTAAFDRRDVMWASDIANDPRSIEFRHALLREGINSVAVAPLISDGETLGALAITHSRVYEWTPADLELFEQLANQASMMLRNTQNYLQMATWAAHLQSIQQLGARLTRLRTVEDIGQAICAELNTLIDFHNVRVYRVQGDDCIPVAWRGQIGEYEGEDMEQLKLKVGEGVTGWVARHGLAQNVGDAASDRRAQTIPGTEDDLDESLLLAPMMFEDDVIGVIVLAKLGLNQFSADDLRLLEIYASIAAQAMANADANEQLHAQSEALSRQLNNQRELLRVTESILSTLDTQALLEEIADRLKTLVQVDNICVDVHDEHEGLLRPIFARGVHAGQFMASTMADDQGVGGYVLRTGEAQLVEDELNDDRVAHFPDLEPQAGALIVAPLRSADRIQGVLTIERLGEEARFAAEEFELVQLFAAHVSIALQNAEAHRAVELRAETDMLTGTWNHGALIERIDDLVSQDAQFAMLMVDLDFFKKYNDRYGHQQGNVMLRNVAESLRACCRDTDQVFRYGGDEFALLLPGTSAAGAWMVAEKVQAAVQSINDGRPTPMVLTCSIGVATYPQDGVDGASIILAADRACYAGKRAGRARIATAAEGLALAGEFQPTEPTPIDRLSSVESAQREPSYSAA